MPSDRCIQTLETISMLAWIVLVLALCVPGGRAYNAFQSEIPNGDHVPHPCKPNFLWHGVGHEVSQGGGPRNPFGLDFAANGFEWTEALCRNDSDGDGMTNGQELGDPDCVWTKGQIPSRSVNITHPGICDVWHDPKCVGRNSWLDCTRDEVFDCPYINDPEVKNMTFRLPRTKVPAQATTYVCFNFELPDDQEYHLIATQPYIDNKNVMHHIAMLACDARFHWTNPTLVDEWFDSSGMTIYYTPKLRRYNAGMMGVGQMYLNIPPMQNSHVEQATCTSACSKKILRGDVYVFGSLHHMHYLGIRQNTTLIQPGNKTMVISDDNPFAYDTPKVYLYDPPIIIRPGDVLKTDCTFQSRSRSKTTTYGDGSHDEMCLSFMYFYPRENIGDPYCFQWKDTDLCDFYSKCTLRSFVNTTNPSTAAAIDQVLANCDSTGLFCRPECPEVIANVTASNGCIKYFWDYVSAYIFEKEDDAVLMKFVMAMNSCSRDDYTTTPTPTQPVATTEKPTGTKPEGPGSMLLNLVKAINARPFIQNIAMSINYNNPGAYYKQEP